MRVKILTAPRLPRYAGASLGRWWPGSGVDRRLGPLRPRPAGTMGSWAPARQEGIRAARRRPAAPCGQWRARWTSAPMGIAKMDGPLPPSPPLTWLQVIDEVDLGPGSAL